MASNDRQTDHVLILLASSRRTVVNYLENAGCTRGLVGWRWGSCHGCGSSCGGGGGVCHADKPAWGGDLVAANPREALLIESLHASAFKNIKRQPTALNPLTLLQGVGKPCSKAADKEKSRRDHASLCELLLTCDETGNS